MKDELRVVAKVVIPKGTHLGFYGGFFSLTDSAGGCSWNLKNGGYLNGRDMLSGYLRYVNAPAHGEKPNTCCRHMIDSHSVQETVYYVTFEEIKEGDDVIVSYGKESGRVTEYFTEQLEAMNMKSNNRNIKALRRAATCARRSPTVPQLEIFESDWTPGDNIV